MIWILMSQTSSLNISQTGTCLFFFFCVCVCVCMSFVFGIMCILNVAINWQCVSDWLNEGLLTFLHFIYAEFSAISTTTTITITSTRVLNITFSTVLKDNNDNNDNNKQEIENDAATGFIIVVIIIVSLSLLYSVYICVKRIKEGDITDCCDAVSGWLYFFIPFFGTIYNDVIDKVSVKAETLKRTLTFFLVILSIVSAFFFTNELNGSIVIFCSINSLCLSCCRPAIDSKIADKWDTKYEGREGSLLYALMIGWLSDTMFDLIQGLTLYLN